jgi:hypothetical protein
MFNDILVMPRTKPALLTQHPPTPSNPNYARTISTLPAAQPVNIVAIVARRLGDSENNASIIWTVSTAVRTDKVPDFHSAGISLSRASRMCATASIRAIEGVFCCHTCCCNAQIQTKQNKKRPNDRQFKTQTKPQKKKKNCTSKN